MSSRLLRWGIVADAHPLAAVAAEPRRRDRRTLRRDLAALPELEPAARQRFHQRAAEQFRLRHRGQSRPDGGEPGRSRRRAARWRRPTASRPPPPSTAISNDKVPLPAGNQSRADPGRVERRRRARRRHRPQGRAASEILALKQPRPRPSAKAFSPSSATRRRSIACKGSSASCNWTTSWRSPTRSMSALRRMRSGLAPRILLLDIADLPAPITEIAAARAVGGPDLELVALGTVNDVALYRDLLAAGANDYLVKPPTRDALAAVLDKRPARAAAGDGGLGQVIVFVGSRGGVGATTTAVGCAWLLGRGFRRADRTARSRPAFRHGCAEARHRARQRVVRGAGAALAHRQPVYRTGDGQGHRESAGARDPRRRRRSI